MARTRALLTPSEREHIDGQGTDQQRYEAISRARGRITDELPIDVALIAANHAELYAELVDVVCDDDPTAAFEELDLDREEQGDRGPRGGDGGEDA